jgi:hypothetical protein
MNGLTNIGTIESWQFILLGGGAMRTTEVNLDYIKGHNDGKEFMKSQVLTLVNDMIENEAHDLEYMKKVVKLL